MLDHGSQISTVTCTVFRGRSLRKCFRNLLLQAATMENSRFACEMGLEYHPIPPLLDVS